MLKESVFSAKFALRIITECSAMSTLNALSKFINISRVLPVLHKRNTASTKQLSEMSNTSTKCFLNVNN